MRYAFAMTIFCASAACGAPPSGTQSVTPDSLASAAASAAAVSTNSLGSDESDRATLAAAASRGMTEVALAGLAKERSHDDDVRGFADYVLDEHGAMQRTLVQLAHLKGIALPTELDDDGTQLYAGLMAQSDVEFDAHFLNDMVGLHENTLKLLNDAATASQDTDVRAWAAQASAQVEAHLAENTRVARLVADKPKGPADPQLTRLAPPRHRP